jgi:hypothetical protein
LEDAFGRSVSSRRRGLVSNTRNKKPGNSAGVHERFHGDALAIVLDPLNGIPLLHLEAERGRKLSIQIATSKDTKLCYELQPVLIAGNQVRHRAGHK